MNIAIVKYNAGNIQSVIYALDRLGANPILTDNPDILKSADKVIFPGQGEASSAMRYLKSKGLDRTLTSLKQPILGICIGLQLLCKYSEEGNVECLGVFDLQVKKFPPLEKVPHIGWNNFSAKRGKLLNGLPTQSYLYYLHSYYAEIGKETTATCDYITSFSVTLEKDNFYAIQPHIEKSGQDGELILQNFLSL